MWTAAIPPYSSQPGPQTGFASTLNEQNKESLEAMEVKSRRTSLFGEEGKAKTVDIYR